MQTQEGLAAQESPWSGKHPLYKLDGSGWFSEEPSSVGLHSVAGYIGGVYDYSGYSPAYCDGHTLPKGSVLLHLKGEAVKGEHAYVQATTVLFPNWEDVSEILHKARVEDIEQLNGKRVKMYLKGENSKNVRVIGIDLL
jgi:hypothetical protein